MNPHDRCPCGGKYQEQTLDISASRGDRGVILADAQQGRCSGCDARVFTVEMLERIENAFARTVVDSRVARREPH